MSTSTSHYAGDGIPTWKVMVAGLWMVILTFVLIISIQVFYAIAVDSIQVSRLNDAPEPAVAVQSEQFAKLNRTGWVNKEKGVVAIPISRAIEITAVELETHRQKELEEK